MKRITDRPYADPVTAAHKLVELAAATESADGCYLHIEQINAPFLFTHGGNGREFGAGLKYAVEHGCLELHQSGTRVRLLTAGREK